MLYVYAWWKVREKLELRTFKTKAFTRFANREGIGDLALCDAVERIGKGLVDADLGGGFVKQRVARPGQGRSRGVRAILVLRRGEQALADELVRLDEAALGAMLTNGTISEVICDDQTV